MPILTACSRRALRGLNYDRETSLPVESSEDLAMSRFCLIAFLSCLVLPVFGRSADNTWVGQRVMPKMNCELKEKGRVIKDSKLNRVPYIVVQTQDDWLLVGDRVPGWVKATDIVPLAEAVAYYSEVLKKTPTDTLALVRRAIAQQALGQFDPAIADYSAVIKAEPKNSLALNNRGSVYSRKKDHAKALADFTAAIQLDPKYSQAYINRGSLHADQEKWDLALADFDKALELDPHDARAHYNRGSVWEAKGNQEKAIVEYKEAIRSNTRDPLAYNNLAWILATSANNQIRDGKIAVEVATKACDLTNWKDSENLDTLAAAFAETGNWAKAVETQEIAVRLSTTADAKADLQTRVELYKQQKPFRIK